MNTDLLLSVRGLHKRFDDLKVLNDVTFDMPRGQTLAVIGPSGGGKSTLLRCLIALERAQAGSITFCGESLVADGVYPKDTVVRRICRPMGMVFQNFNLFPHLSVERNLTLACRCAGESDREALRARALEQLELVGLTDKIDQKPGTLSGGQKQRVAIARALMRKPELLLFDEPTSSLDPLLTGEVLAVMRDLASAHMSMIVVTHEMSFARDAADRILFMDGGTIAADQPPAGIFENPATPQVAAFVGKIDKNS